MSPGRVKKARRSSWNGKKLKRKKKQRQHVANEDGGGSKGTREKKGNGRMGAVEKRERRSGELIG